MNGDVILILKDYGIKKKLDNIIVNERFGNNQCYTLEYYTLYNQDNEINENNMINI